LKPMATTAYTLPLVTPERMYWTTSSDDMRGPDRGSLR
jgi:hypothetical protein